MDFIQVFYIFARGNRKPKVPKLFCLWHWSCSSAEQNGVNELENNDNTR